MFGIDRDDVTGRYWSGLKKIALSFSDFEPIGRYRGVGPGITAWLLEHGLIEAGENPRYSETCYRVSELGRRVLKRGKHAQKPLRKSPPLTTVPPLVPPAPPLLTPAQRKR